MSQMNYALQSVTSSDGTGSTAGKLDRPVAGKTGTSSGPWSAWFIGYTPQMVTVVDMYQVGSKGEEEVLTPFGKYTYGIGGGSFPAEIWLRYMEVATDGMKVENFPKPKKRVTPTGDDETETPAKKPSQAPTTRADRRLRRPASRRRRPSAPRPSRRARRPRPRPGLPNPPRRLPLCLRPLLLPSRVKMRHSRPNSLGSKRPDAAPRRGRPRSGAGERSARRAPGTRSQLRPVAGERCLLPQGAGAWARRPGGGRPETGQRLPLTGRIRFRCPARLSGCSVFRPAPAFGPFRRQTH